MPLKSHRLKSLRVHQGLSQEDAADRLGISARQYRRYEAEESDASSEVVSKIAVEFGVSTDWLLGLADDPSGALASREVAESRLLQVFSELSREQMESLIHFALFLKSQRVGNGIK